MRDTMNGPVTEPAMKVVWDAAAKAFEDICGHSLARGEVKSFDDVQQRIESSSEASYGLDEATTTNGRRPRAWDSSRSSFSRCSSGPPLRLFHS